MSGDDFYVGYQRRAPPGLARFLRRVVAGLLLGAAAFAVLFVALESPFDPGVFEFGRLRSFTGTVVAEPYPLLRIERPAGGSSPAVEPASLFPLVAFGKRGAGELVAGRDGRRITLEGTLVYRGDWTMIEVADGSIAEAEPPSEPGPSPVGAAVAAPAREVVGRARLVGEIVDGKCYLGVMKPGRDKPHRACAVRCISGGIPPLFRVEPADGPPAHYLLVDEQGGAVNDRVLDRIALPLVIEGEVWRLGDRLVLAADPDRYELFEAESGP